jgi:TonB family protein
MLAVWAMALLPLGLLSQAEAQERRKPAANQACSVTQFDQRTQRPPTPDSSSDASLNWKTTTDSIRQLVDSAGIEQRGLIVFQKDTLARDHDIDFVDLEYPRSLRDEITRRIVDHIKRWPDPWRILPMGPDEVPWDTTRISFESCTPTLRNRDHITRLLRTAVGQYPGGRARVPRDPRTVNMWLYTNRTGRVILAVVKDPSGDAYFDHTASRIGREFQFHPALRDGFPVEVWVQVPIRFEIRR